MIIVETSVFTRQVRTLLSDDEYSKLQNHLVLNPEAGKIIPSSGGLRKIRWVGKGLGKRGGNRIIYYWAVQQDHILMLLIYAKGQQEDLTSDQLKLLKRIVEEEYP
jgi:mRNA-degrading endonuclease RelE of RelBE toxin-antitoxin system